MMELYHMMFYAALDENKRYHSHKIQVKLKSLIKQYGHNKHACNKQQQSSTKQNINK